MPRLTDAELTAFLDEPGHLLRLGTVDADGRPRVVPVWFVARDGEVLFTPRGPSVFLANLRRDPRVGLSIDEETLPYRKLTVQATARIVHDVGDDDAWRDLYRAIARRYVPTDAADAYVDGTIDQPRALVAVPVAGEGVSTSTWRMPLTGEDPTGIWHRRYYGNGTMMAERADAAGRQEGTLG
jgi:PPOX class probable F420-dependent enzyme